ncbi:MAG: hypothetical protein WB643_13800 [Candidatus Bathyarchaeia archaeon]
MSSAQSQVQTSSAKRFKPTSIVYWMRVLLAIVAGFANQFLHIDQATFGDFALFIGIGLGIVIYAFSIFIIRRVLHFGEVELKGKNRHITLGGGTFIVLWIVVSVFLYTLLG